MGIIAVVTEEECLVRNYMLVRVLPLVIALSPRPISPLSLHDEAYVNHVVYGRRDQDLVYRGEGLESASEASARKGRGSKRRARGYRLL